MPRRLVLGLYLLTLLAGPFAGPAIAQHEATPTAERTDTIQETPPADGNSSTEPDGNQPEASAGPINFAPTAVDDSYETLRDTPLSIVAPGILANDSDPEGTALHVQFFGGVTNGNLIMSGDGSFVFTPTSGFSGTASFTYRATDADGHTGNEATVTIAVNRPPVAGNDGYEAVMETSLTVGAPGLLANDFDPDGDPLTVDLIFPPLHGDLTLNADGSFVYTPFPGFAGGDAFDYFAFDGQLTAFATVTITVIDPASDTPPVALADAYTVAKGAILTVDAAKGLLANDSDPDNDPLFVAGIAPPGLPSGGTIEANAINSDGSFRYRSHPNFVGTDTFNYLLSDGIVTSVGTVTITVTDPAANAPPIAVDETYTIRQDTTLTVAAPGLLANDSDPDGDPLEVGGSSSTSHGTKGLFVDGSFTFTPDAGFVGTAGFNYFASDGTDFSVGIVTIFVTANQPPVAVDDSFTMLKDTTLTVDAPGLLANDSDPDGDTLRVAGSSSTSNGVKGLFVDGSFTFTPDSGFAGTAGFNYFSGDGVDHSVGTVTITVIDPANTPPITNDDHYAVYQGKPLTVATVAGVLANDRDPDGDKLTARVIDPPTRGTIVFQANGGFVYTLQPGVTGTDSFTYVAEDGKGGSTMATVALSVVVATPSAICRGLPATIVVTDPGAIVYGTGGNDVIAVLVDKVEVYARGGNDSLCGGISTTLYGESGADALNGGGVADGGSGNDTVETAGKAYGGSGNDQLASPSFCDGGGGTDTVISGCPARVAIP